MPTIKVTDANPNWCPPNHSRNSRVSQGRLLSAGVKFNPLSMPPSLREGRYVWIMVDGGKMCNVETLKLILNEKSHLNLLVRCLEKNFQTYYPPMVGAIRRANPMVLSPLKNHQNKKKSDQATWMSRDGSCRKRVRI